MPNNPQYAPIVVFCYNRADKIKLVLENLSKNALAKNSDLFVFCDGPRNESDLEEVKKTHKVLEQISGFKNITIEKRELNRGLAKSVIYGVSKVLSLYESVIVLEDDIIVSSNFLEFMNNALAFYRDDKKIFSVTGFNYPQFMFKTPDNFNDDIFFIQGRGSSWSWGSWKDRWQAVDFNVTDYKNFRNNPKMQREFNCFGSNLSEMLNFQMNGKVDSWAIRVAYHQFKNSLYTVFPIKTFVKNIGLDGSGSHGDFNHKMNDFILENTTSNPLLKKLSEVKNNDLAAKEFIRCVNKKSEFLSKKTKLKLRYVALGFLLAELINFICDFF